MAFPFDFTRLPLSGDVTQAINPWSWWLNSMHQSGFININTVQSRDPGLEKEIVQNVASYGRQLGRISDVLEALCRTPAVAQELGSEGREAVKDFLALAENIRKAKERHAVQAVAGLEGTIAALRTLKASDPERYAAVASRLQQALDE